MYARTTFLIGVWVMIVTASSMAQTPPSGVGTTPVTKAQTDLDQIVVSILKEVHNRGAELYNRGDAAGCYRMYEGALVTVKAFLAHRPATQKIIDNGLTEVAKTDGAKIQAFRLHEVIEQVRGELKTESKTLEGSTPDPMPTVKEVIPAPKPKSEAPKPPATDATVSGAVTLLGKPLTDCEVTIVSMTLSKPRVFTAKVEAGQYKFDGPIPLGKYVVIVTGSPADPIPEKYKTTQTSNLRVDVKAGGNNFDLNLQ